jgi:putative phosphoesterase
MLVVLSDTHETDPPELSAHLADAVADAERVIHAGDFTTAAVLDFFERQNSLTAVPGNRDEPAVCERLPETATVEWGDLRLVVVHGHRRDATALSLLARQENADVVVRGHSHRPRLDTLGDAVLLNPGSHADPRGNRPGYAVVARDSGAVRIELRSPTGECVDSRLL